jgi:hypothetical protein
MELHNLRSIGQVPVWSSGIGLDQAQTRWRPRPPDSPADNSAPSQRPESNAIHLDGGTEHRSQLAVTE